MAFSKKILPIMLHLFDGEGGGDGGAGMGDSTGTAATTQAAPGDSMTDTPAAGEQTEQAEAAVPKAKTQEELRKEYDDFINSDEMREIHTKEMQRIINRRFKDSKTMQAQLESQRPVLELLMGKYGIRDGDVNKLTQAVRQDADIWSQAAEDAGMTTDQYLHVRDLETQNAQANQLLQQFYQQEQDRAKAQAWKAESEAVKAKYPDFDLRTELEDPDFCHMLDSGVSMEDSYIVRHINDIVSQTAKTTEKKVADNVRARGQRPAENGANSQGSFTTKTDPSKMTIKDFEDIQRRVARGERIVLH